jgi:endoglucanase
MNIRRAYQFPLVFAAILFLVCCHKKEVIAPELSISPSEEIFTSNGGTSEVTVTSNTSWSINKLASWLTATPSTTKGNGKIFLNVQANPTTSERSVVIAVSAASISKETRVRQLGKGSTDSVPPDPTGMSNDAVQVAAKIKMGINIGNTLEAIGGETAWGNPKVTKAFIDLARQSGFNAIRIPCSFDQYANTSNVIRAEWLARVKEVVQYCIDDSMYAILNIHWDGGWLENNVNTAKQDGVNAKQKSYWTQIATALRDFDEHLVFASANEPNASDAIQMNVLLSYHQTFIDAVRSTGGHNRYRVLIVQGPNTDIETTNKLMNTLPVDPTPNRMMVEIHYYTPWNFCGMTKDESWGNMFYYWGSGYHSTADPPHNANWGEETDVDKYMGMMKTKFVDKGIPVVLGEYGPMIRANLTGDALALHLASRAYYLKYVTHSATVNGILPFLWDTGSLLSRSGSSVLDRQSLDALIQGVQ